MNPTGKLPLHTCTAGVPPAPILTCRLSPDTQRTISEHSRAYDHLWVKGTGRRPPGQRPGCAANRQERGRSPEAAIAADRLRAGGNVRRGALYSDLHAGRVGNPERERYTFSASRRTRRSAGLMNRIMVIAEWQRAWRALRAGRGSGAGRLV